jgi:hypothetical protein
LFGRIHRGTSDAQDFDTDRVKKGGQRLVVGPEIADTKGAAFSKKECLSAGEPHCLSALLHVGGDAAQLGVDPQVPFTQEAGYKEWTMLY